MDDNRNSNPPLSKIGLQRAVDLNELFAGKPIDYLFSAPYLRTQQTLLPFAVGIFIITYCWKSIFSAPPSSVSVILNATAYLEGFIWSPLTFAYAQVNSAPKYNMAAE